MTPEESGRKGGKANRDNHSFTCPITKKPCIEMVRAYFAKVGSEGGKATAERRHPGLCQIIGRFAGRGVTKEKRIAKFGYDPLPEAISAFTDAVSSPGRGDIEQEQEAGVVAITTDCGCLRQSQPGGII